MEKRYRTIFGFWALAFVLITSQVKSQTAGGANGMVFRFTKQVWLNPTIILAKQNFEQSTNVKLLILPRVNGNDTTGTSRIEKAFDMLLSFLVFKDNVQGSIKFYFNPKNPSKPFTFNTSEEVACKFTPIQKDSVETILNQDIVNSSNLNNFTALPFDSIINRASRYCKRILLSKPGQCGPNTENEFTLTQINSTPAKLNFEKGTITNSTAPNGGVDKKKYAELDQYYNSVVDVADNSNYPLAWKAMAANTNDVIKIKLKKKEGYFNMNKLVFKNANGTETYNVTYPNIASDSLIHLSISGKSPGTMAEVVAYYTPTTTPTQTFAIGAFNVQFYEKKEFTVVLVNVGNAALADTYTTNVQNTLNEVYGNAFVRWTVQSVSYSLPGSIGKSIHVENSSLLSNYMPDMQPIVSSFKDNCSAYKGNESNTYYLIYGCTNDGSLTGYMPRARNTGFIFDLEPRTVAHELGHGAFNLKHIFSSDELGEGNKYQTNNIMDYSADPSGNSKLATYKYQWDLIHDPSFVSWFGGDDDEGALLENQNYFNPAGLPFHSTINASTILYSKDLINGTKLNGILYGFEVNGITYEAKVDNNKFYGYYNGANRYADPAQNNFSNGAKIVVKSMNFVGNCQVQYYLVDYTVPATLNDAYYQNGASIISSFNATAGKKVGNAVPIPKCPADYDAPLTSGVGKQMYDTYNVNINAADTAALRELKRIGNLINKLGPGLYNSFKAAKEWNNNPESDLFRFFHYPNSSSPAWTKQSLNSTFLSIKKYSDAVDQFKLLTNNDNFTTTQLKTIINENFVCCNSFKFLFKAPFYTLSATQRNNILKVFLNDAWVTGRGNIGEDFKNEDIILNTITTTTDRAQHKPMLEFLKSNGLIYKIVKNVDGGNYEAVTSTLTNWIIEEYPVPQANIITLSNNKQMLHFNDDYFGRQNTELIFPDNSIKLIVQKWSGTLDYQVKADPYEYIEVTFQNNFSIGSGSSKSDFVQNVPYKLPAMYVYMLFNSDTQAKWMTSGKIVVDVALLVIGVGEIRAAIKAGEWATAALAVADMGIGFGDIIISTAFKNEIQAKYPKFFETWQKISLCYGIGRISQVGLTAAYKRCFVESQIIHNRNAFSQTTRNTASEIETRLQNPANFAEFIDQPALASELTFFTNLDNNYPTITARIGQMDDETRLAFYTEFQSNPNNALQNFQSNPSQLDNWVQTRQVTLANEIAWGISRPNFFGSVPEFANGANPVLAEQAWDLYKQKKWSELENFFTTNNLNRPWPPASGGYNMITTDLKKGMRFDRYQESFNGLNANGDPVLRGSFTSPLENSTPFTYPQRALKAAENQNALYYEIELLDDLPFNGETSDVIPWFNQVGNGKQTKFNIANNPSTGYPYTWNELADLGYIKITIKSSPNGNHTNLVNRIIQK